MSETTPTTQLNEADPYPVDEYVSTKIHSLGKYALDSSTEYYETMINSSPGVMASRRILESMRKINAPEFLIKNAEQILSKKEEQSRTEQEEYRNPEKYRTILQSWKDEAKSNGFGDIFLKNKQRFDRLNDVFNSWEPTPFIDNSLRPEIGKESGKRNYIKAILDKDENGEYKLTTEQFRNLLQWHNFNHRKAEEKFFENLPQYKDQFKQKLQQLLADNQVPKNALDNIEKIDHIDFILDDGLTSVIDQTGGTNQGGFEGPDVITISPDQMNFHVVAHELLHSIQGSCVDEDSDYAESNWIVWAEQAVPPTVRRRIDPEDEYDIETYERTKQEQKKYSIYLKVMRGIMEATCEELASKIADTPESHQSYAKERKVLKTLTKGSGGVLSMRDFEEAFFENDIKKYGDFIKKIKSAYPSVKDVVLYIDRLRQEQDQLRQPSKQEKLLNAIFNK